MPSQEGVNHRMQLVWDQEWAEKIIKIVNLYLFEDNYLVEIRFNLSVIRL